MEKINWNKIKTAQICTAAIKKNLFDCPIGIKPDSWFELYSAALGKMTANQENCSEFVVKGRDWNADLSAGIITFGSDVFPIQFIGSESTSSGTWLWSWENVNGFNDNILSLANSTKAIGEMRH
ncbi:MAG: hypothetical protein LBT26_11920 [Clostridiales Family XIII bacterium]|jgi:hypothetical protein|nr:hypothetical protein [Clostridiales Family XIII bacterium]